MMDTNSFNPHGWTCDVSAQPLFPTFDIAWAELEKPTAGP
jgi:hypothetical protein